ncbi:MAG: sugar phosphorylase [Anaerolineae bacterium]|nr:sugar phosphorylase [Anaerolineae bacterium]
MNDMIRNHLTFLYGAETAADVLPRLEALLTRYRGKLAFDHDKAAFFDERDAVLITYGDMVQAEGQAPLATLAAFAQRTLSGVVSTIHVLPFYPYTSDDGFSVVDYLAVNPALGDWDDVARVGNGFRLMFDAVINHISAESAWFQAFLRGEAPYTDYFTVVEPGTDLSAVFRPRTLPLLTPAETPSGTKYVWTTFSADQIDLNYASPDVMLAIIDVLLSYVAHGADLIRLDAIGFMWKEIGTSCIHLPQAHAAIQLIRAVLDVVAPATILVTETNVPHRDNISYFGNGTNEAQMVYNFTLPPLTLHSFHTGDATVLSRWAATLDTPSDRATYFNFLASHDGIGVTPARGLLSSSEIDALAQRVQALGGFVSFKTNSDGSQSAYELNINYLDALGRPGEQVSADYLARRFLAAQAVMLALRGVPGIYFHSLFGSQGWPEGVAETGRARTINREKLRLAQIEAALATAGSLRQRVYDGFCRLLRARSADRAFHPNGGQRILTLDPALFAVERSAPDGSSRVLCLQNVSDEAVIVSAESGTDLLSNRHHMGGKLSVPPYGIVWLKLPLT